MQFISTRNKTLKVDSLTAIFEGISKSDGGLYVPSSFPKITAAELETLLPLSYEERAAFVMHKFLDELSYDELLEICKSAYSKFDEESKETSPAPLVKIDSQTYVLELWHGPTAAFKDMALTVLPYLLVKAKKKLGIDQQTLILTATSGDTGKAALEGFCDVDGTKIVVFYPSEGVSTAQKKQMTTQKGKNVQVYGITGNFDDAQNTVKAIFEDAEFNAEISKYNTTLSSANSINFGRLLPQVVYYFNAYLDLVDGEEIAMGDKVNFCVPTGNFGNILAAYYAKLMGLPVGTLICASNKNDVLTDFFDSGSYDIKREFFKTSSPSMDILISSNLERLLFEISGRDDALTKSRMLELKKGGEYNISEAEWQKLNDEFWANYCSEEETAEAIKEMYDETGYLMDTHTAVAAYVFKSYSVSSEDNETPTVIVSTANPYKFCESVLEALELAPQKTLQKSFDLLEEETAMPPPACLCGLEKQKVRFDEVIEKEEAKQKVLDFCQR